MNLKETILIDEHRKLNAKLAPFGGWLMPIQYTGIIDEHNWTRNSSSLFDICHMGEFILKGDFENIVTVNLAKMPEKSCRYGFILNEKGGVIDDIVVYKIKNDEYMLVCNAATKDADKEHILKNGDTSRCSVKDVSEETAKIDLQGPLSKEILKNIAGEKIKALRYYTFDYFELLGEKVIISRTGYTGELGYELYIKKDKAKELWNFLLKDQRVKPAGLGARDTLRLEMCFPLYGQDIDENITPLEADDKRFLDMSKDFIGKKGLSSENEKILTCFISESRRAPRHNYKIYKENEEIGVVTSGSFSPSLLKGIGLGYVKKEYDKKDADIILKDSTIEIKAKVKEKPLYKKGSARN